MQVKPLLNDKHNLYFRGFVKLACLLVILSLGAAAYMQWNAFVLTTVEWQRTLHSMLATHIQAVSNDAYKYGGALVILSFAYGVFHAIGPGHGKAVIVTYLGSNKQSVWKGIFISFTAAILQSIIAVLLVSTLARFLKFKLADVQSYGADIASVSYLLVIVLGCMVLFGFVKRWIALRRAMPQTGHSDANSLSHEESHPLMQSQDHDHAHDHSQAHTHEHDASCGCSHSHLPRQDESVWQTLMVILSMGCRPCSGAIVVLIYAHLVGVYSFGMLATLMMGVGTGLSISLIAVGTLYARTLLERFIQVSDNEIVHAANAYDVYLRGIGGVVLVGLGWSLYSAASLSDATRPLF